MSSKDRRSTLTGAGAPLKRGTKLTLMSASGEPAEEVLAEDIGMAEESQPKSAGILYNAHDVKRLEEECSKIAGQFLKLGAQPQHLEATIAGWRQAATIFSLGRLMMLKGLVTEDELQGEELARLKDMLLENLQEFENAQIAARQPQVQAVRKPGLIVATH